MWILRTGAPRKDLPVRYPPYQTCHRRYQKWCRDGKIERALHALAEHLHERGGIDITEAFIDGIFAGAEERASPPGSPKQAGLPGPMRCAICQNPTRWDRGPASRRSGGVERDRRGEPR